MISRKLSPSMQLSLIFLLFGIAWILLTDILFVNLANNNFLALSRSQTYKGLLFVIISALIVYFASLKIFARQRQLQQALADEKILYKNQLAQEVFNAQEGERKKLGEELHDNVNQILGVIKLYIEHAQVNPAAKDEMLKKSAEYLMQVINEIRGLSKALISPTLQDIGLIASILELIESIQQIKTIEIELHADNFEEKNLPDIKKLMVYRILQEQLNNILKHSKAEHVEIELRQTAPNVYLRIEDDGMGFDASRIKSGLGFKNIRHRLELINGNMQIESSPGEGCKIEAFFKAD